MASRSARRGTTSSKTAAPIFVMAMVARTYPKRVSDFMSRFGILPLASYNRNVLESLPFFSFFLSSTSTNTENICQQIDNLCTQICEPTDKSYVCRCREGYELLEDNITCVKKTNVIDNEIPQDVRRGNASTDE